MRLIIIGSGYVGLVSGACLAELGHHVLCVDNDAGKVERLQAGDIPIFEPKLSDMITRNVARGRLGFTSRLPPLGKEVDIVMVAVGTPPSATGSADLSAIFAVAQEIAIKSIHPPVVAIKSTVPVGTGDRVQELMNQLRPDLSFAVVSNPEFLREGAAIDDFLEPDRIVIGAQDSIARDKVRALYEPLSQIGTPVLCVARREAELVKCAANAFLAAKITFINEIADLCEAVEADVDRVAQGIGLDRRIGEAFLKAGPGYGGSCFPKDTTALLATAQEYGVNLRLVENTIASNESRKRAIGKRVTKAMGGDIGGRTVAVLGLTFKPDTDDMRDAPPLAVIQSLQRSGARIKVYDPQGMIRARGHLQAVTYSESAYQCAEGADCIILATHWQEFTLLDPDLLARVVRSKVLVDLRNFLDAQRFVDAGFVVHGIGRPSQHPAAPIAVVVRRQGQIRKLQPVHINGALPPMPVPPLQDGAAT